MQQTTNMADLNATDSENAQPLTSEEQANTMKRQDAIREILLEFSRCRIPSMDFLDVLVVVFSGEYRYTHRNIIIKKLFVGETMLSEAEADDYAALSTLLRLSHLVTPI